jgi:heterodisulfide reductase subunit A-like polyferredoxin
MIYEKEKRYIIAFGDVPSPRAEMPEITIDERRGNFVEVETGFPEQIAVKEAKRCLACRRCLGCALCWAECKPEAIDFSIPDEEVDLEFDEAVLTKGQENAFQSFPDNLGYGVYADVITDLQFERMLSPAGPSDGLVVSPLNGDIPGRIAVVQGNVREDENHLLSSTVLGVNEAILALHNTDGLRVTLVSPLTETFKERFLDEIKNISGLELVDGEPKFVERVEGGNPLSVTFSRNGNDETEDFDLVVILTKPDISAEIRALSRKLDQEIQ